MLNTGCNAYKQSVGKTVLSKEQILLKLYQGMLKFINIAKRGIESKNPKIRGENISKIMAILTELNCALDREKGGELSENLTELYNYMINKLTVANIENDLKAVEEVEELIKELYDGFKEAALKGRKKPEVKENIAQPKKQGGIRFAV